MALSKVDLANQVENILPETLGGTGASQFPAQFRNIIINGDMSIAQRGTSSSGNTTDVMQVDRMTVAISSSGTYTISQDTDVPTGQGFAKSIKIDNTSATSGGTISVYQKIEGQMLQYLKKGTANAESITVSFWVKSNKTGTGVCELYDNDNTRQISATYTINSADTWEKKTITFPGDTIGALDNDNNLSMYCFIWFDALAVLKTGTLNTSWNTSVTGNRVVGANLDLGDSTSNYANVTGFQMEAGTTASDFEFLPYDVNFERCGRYYEKSYSYATAIGTATNTGMRLGGHNSSATTGYLNNNTVFSYYKRTTPTITIYDNGGNSGKCTRSTFGSSEFQNQNVGVDSQNEKSFHAYSNTGSSSYVMYYHFIADAEL